MWHVVSKINLIHGILGYVIEHGQVKGSHMTLNVQHESLNKLISKGNHVSWEDDKPKSRLA